MSDHLCPTCHGSGFVSDSELDTLLAREPHTRFRSASTSTSADAARMLDADTCRTNHRLILQVLAFSPEGLSDEQISSAVNSYKRLVPWPSISSSTLRARRSELMHAGLVEDSGRRRAKSDTGRQCAVWTITELGRSVPLSA